MKITLWPTLQQQTERKWHE